MSYVNVSFNIGKILLRIVQLGYLQNFDVNILWTHEIRPDDNDKLHVHAKKRVSRRNRTPYYIEPPNFSGVFRKDMSDLFGVDFEIMPKIVPDVTVDELLSCKI
jgi:hypothetical protein